MIARLGDGWLGDERAKARVSRDGDTLVVDELEGDASAREVLLDELAGVVTSVSRIVDREGGVLRAVKPVPVDRPSPLTLARLEEAIRSAWSAETSDRPGWGEENPAFQHCDVTSLLVQEYLGGEILVCGVVLDGQRVDRHAWNRLPSGLEVDLTREQFVHGERFEAPAVLVEDVGPKVRARYAVFAARVREQLG